MKKLTIKTISILFALIFIVGCSNKIPVFETGIKQDLTSVIHTIKTSLIIDKEKVSLSATSFHIGNGYILTCTHGIKITSRTIRTPFGFMEVPVKGIDYKYRINDKEIKLVGEVEDISLLYSPDIIGSPMVIFQNSDYLKLGDKLMLIGNSNMDGINIKTGIVSILRLNKSILGLLPETAPESFVITNPTNNGDSGGPVFVIENGSYYFIGMVYGLWKGVDGYGYVIKSNYILGIIKKIKSGAS